MSTQLLLIDDDEIFMMLAKFAVENSDFHPSPLDFRNGKLALEYLKEHYNLSDNYIIFLDINMPVMDGWEFLDAIKEFAEPSNTFVFMVSSSTDRGDVEKASKNEFVIDFLSKPIYKETFEEIKLMPELKEILS